MDVRPIPCLTDNYAYLLVRDHHAVVVDPSEAAPVLAALAGRPLHAIWCTHHHWDHVGGIPELTARFPGIPVVASRYDLDHARIPGQTVAVDEPDRVLSGPLAALVHAIPGHTLGAIAFEVEGHIFTGDTLFAGGCGRVFEGTMPMMRASIEKLGALDPALRMWCGHEYTVKNLEFTEAIAATPAVTARLAYARARRARGQHTVGDPLAFEHGTNPFLRLDTPEVVAASGADPTDADAIFAAIRARKDTW